MQHTAELHTLQKNPNKPVSLVAQTWKGHLAKDYSKRHHFRFLLDVHLWEEKLES